MIELKDAVKLAKSYIEDIFEGEHISKIGLEEISRSGNTWNVTIGFFRPWTAMRNALVVDIDPSYGRIYRNVRINATNGELIDIKQRDTK